MKKIFFALLCLLSVPAFAAGSANRKVASEECPPDAEKIIEKVLAAETCYDAARFAKHCAWGSNVDIQIAGAASEVCEKDFKKMKAKDKQTMEYMRTRCSQKYKNAEGSLARSMLSFCMLSVSEFWSEIYTPVQN